MSLKMFFSIITLAALSGCANTIESKEPNTANNQSEPLSQEQREFLIKMVHEKGVECRREKIKTGSRFKTNRCTTRAQREALAATARSGMRRTQQMNGQNDGLVQLATISQ